MAAAEIPEKMPDKAEVVWLDEPGTLLLKEERLGRPEAGQILCKTIVTAISPGTELAAYNGLPPLRPSVVYPRLQGYCNVAEILSTGSGVSDYQPGDRILSFSSHRSHFVISQNEILYKLPVSANADDIVCAYLFHLGYNAVLSGGVRAGSNVMVIGLGVLGLTSVAMAHVAGAKVCALSGHEKPAQLARHFGASSVRSREDCNSMESIFDGKGADCVITTTNSWTDWKIALAAAAQAGTIACLGFPGRGDAPGDFNPLDSQYFYMKQLSIKAVGLSPEQDDSRGFLRFNERSNLAYIAGKIADGGLDAKAIVSGRYPARNIDDAYKDLIARKNSPITYLLDWK